LICLALLRVDELLNQLDDDDDEEGQHNEEAEEDHSALAVLPLRVRHNSNIITHPIKPRKANKHIRIRQKEDMANGSFMDRDDGIRLDRDKPYIDSTH
jgi:hypothetical protein